MKVRRHHNRKGYRQIKRGKTIEQVKTMARRLGVPYGRKVTAPESTDKTSGPSTAV